MFIDHVNVCVSRVNIKYVFVVAGWVLPVHFLEDAIYLITTITHSTVGKKWLIIEKIQENIFFNTDFKFLDHNSFIEESGQHKITLWI